MRGVPESEIRLAGWGDRGFSRFPELDARNHIQTKAVRMEMVGIDHARCKKRGWTLGVIDMHKEKKNLAGTGRAAEEWTLQGPHLGHLGRC
jgi:hypothetical protein